MVAPPTFEDEAPARTMPPPQRAPTPTPEEIAVEEAKVEPEPPGVTGGRIDRPPSVNIYGFRPNQCRVRHADTMALAALSILTSLRG